MKIDLASGHAEGRSGLFIGHKCINFMPISLAPEDVPKTGLILENTPGLTEISNLGAGPVQGFARLHDLKYVVCNDVVYSLEDSGNTVSVGTITSNGKSRVCLIPGGNNYIMICAGVNSYVLDVTTTTVTQITNPNFAGADRGIYQDGYWCVAYNGDFYYSELQDPFTWSGSSVIEASNKPSNIKAIGSVQEELYLLGEKTIEVFYNDGSTPFVRRTFSTLDYGIAEGDTLCHVDNSIIFLSRSYDGLIRVLQVTGQQMMILSTEAISYELSAASSLNGSYAVAYSERGHTIYAVSIPNMNKTYTIDLASKQWHIRQSHYYNDSSGVPIYDCWRNNCTLYTGSDIIVGDRLLGKLYRLDFDTLQENGETLTRIFETVAFAQEARYLSIGEIELDIETGMGGDIPKPQLALQVSKDGGKTWSAEKWRHIGKKGEYDQYVVWHTLGRAKNWKLRFSYSENVPLKIGSISAHGYESST